MSDEAPATTQADQKQAKAVKKNIRAMGKLKAGYPPAGVGQTLGEIAFNAFAFYILNITGPKISAGWIDTTSMATEPESSGVGNKTGIASMYNDAGEMDVESLFDPSDFPPPFGQSECGVLTLTIGPSATSFSFIATLIGFEPKMPLEGRPMVADCKFRISGAIT